MASAPRASAVSTSKGMMKNGRLTELLERRSAWGWLGGYAVAAWVVLQVVDTLGSLIGLPLWFGKAILGLLGFGLLVVLVTALVHAPRGALATSETEAELRLRRLFTWRRAVLAGLAAVVLLGIGAAGHMTARALGVGPAGTLMAKGLISEDAELVLADFEDHVGDAGIARASTQAFRVHLSQSPTVRLASPARVGEVLARMELDRSQPLDLPTAREVAIREGLRAVVAGDIHQVGSRYAISARVVAAESGEELASALETADEPDDLIPAVERLSVRLRERIGESLASVRRSPPLSRVRTASLAALKSYTEAIDANSRGDFERCALLMNEAIALDSTFATAYVGRAACNQNLNRNTALQVADRVRAYEMRERMTEEERLRFTAIYHQFVTEDRKLAVEAWEAYAARYPDDPPAVFALANLYAEGREWARAEETLARGLALDPARIVVLINLAGFQANQGRFGDAEATLDRLARAEPELDLGWRRAALKLSAGDWAGAEAELAVARERARGNPGLRSVVAAVQSVLARTLGKVDESERLLREGMATDLEAGDIRVYHQGAIALAELYLNARRDTAGALVVLDEALSAHPLDSLDPFERGYFEFAEVFAIAGRLAQARALVEEWQREVAPQVPGSSVPHWVRAAFAEAEGRWQDVIAEWRLEDEVREDPLPALVQIGDAFDRLGQPDSAIAYYHRFLTTPSRQRYDTDPTWRGRVLGRLAELHDARGEKAEAARYYAMLAELWSGADPTLQPHVAAARARLAALYAES